MNTSTLLIKDLTFKVHLGATKEERSKKQPVILNLSVFFNELPRACNTDNLEDTICYDTLIKKIKDFCSKKEFQLIEFLGYELYKLIKLNLPKKCAILLSIEKHPKITGLGGSIFSIDDRK